MDQIERARAKAQKRRRTETFHLLVKEFGMPPAEAVSLMRTVDKLRVDLWKEPH